MRHLRFKALDIRPAAAKQHLKYRQCVCWCVVQVVESGSLDLAAAWGDAGRGVDMGVNIPAFLVLRVMLPGCVSAASMELDVQKRCVDLCIPGTAPQLATASLA